MNMAAYSGAANFFGRVPIAVQKRHMVRISSVVRVDWPQGQITGWSRGLA